jgi:hypothetical protein
VEQPPHALAAPGFWHTTLFIPEQAHVPPPHWPQLVFGWFERVEQPPHALLAPALLHTTASVPEQPQVPPPHWPHTVFGWFASV